MPDAGRTSPRRCVDVVETDHAEAACDQSRGATQVAVVDMLPPLMTCMTPRAPLLRGDALTLVTGFPSNSPLPIGLDLAPLGDIVTPTVLRRPRRHQPGG